MNQPPVERLHGFVRHLAVGAGAILRARFKQQRSIAHKEMANDLVTDADRASEAWLVHEVEKAFPSHAILAEEGGAQGVPAGAPVVWIMDPLDGTTNYAHGFPHFCVSVAACTPAGLPLAGAVMDPMRGELFHAARGRGAFLDEVPSGRTALRLAVSGCPSLDVSLLATGFPYDRAHAQDNNHAEHDVLSLQTHGVRRPGAAALDLAYVACGRLDGYWEAQLKPWDLAAGALLVEEAGGVCTGYAGEAFDGSQSAVVTAGPLLHPPLLDALRTTRARLGYPATPPRR